MVKAHLNPGLDVSTILLTMYDARTRLSAGVAEEVRSHFGDQVLRTAIPRSVRISEAPSYGQTVMTYDPGSPGALSYLEAAREMAFKGHRQEDPSDPEARTATRTRPWARVADPDRAPAPRGRHGSPPARAHRPPRRRRGCRRPTVTAGTAGCRDGDPGRPPRDAVAGGDGDAGGSTAAAATPRRRSESGLAPSRAPTSPSSRSPRSRPTRGSRARSSRRRRWPSWSTRSRRSGCSSRSWSVQIGDDRYELIMGERRWRATQEAGLETIPAIVRETGDDACCATRCWRTCTARSSTRSRRRPPTSSCSTTSGARTRSSPAGSAAAGRRSATRCVCCGSPRRCSGGWPPACSPPATPAPCSRSTTADVQDRLAARVIAEGISVRGLEEIVAVGDLGSGTKPSLAPRTASRTHRPWPTWPPGCRTGSRPGSRSTSASPRARSPSSSPRSPTSSGSSRSWTRRTPGVTATDRQSDLSTKVQSDKSAKR